MTFLDTHALIWLYKGEPDQLGPKARAAIERDDLVAPAAAVLELEFLHEIGRLKVQGLTLIAALAAEIGLSISDVSGRILMEHAVMEKWTRDPFDRLIVADARAAEAPLVTKDALMHRHYASALW